MKILISILGIIIGSYYGNLLAKLLLNLQNNKVVIPKSIRYIQYPEEFSLITNFDTLNCIKRNDTLIIQFR